jgi:predicted metalloprotease with PDZ domain
VAIVNPGELDREKLVSILKRMVESAVTIVGEIPYNHYTFIMMGRGMGGLEHSNSMAVYTSIPNLDDPNDYKGWLTFIAHEFFHLYNVKRIRPIALGPFDYDKENPTNMLWLSEGGTVYYEYVILNRAGFIGRDEVLEKLGKSINSYESSPGNKTMTVAKASYDAWTMPFFGGGDTISYYDKGAGLCLLLDLKIRHETKNQKSLDDVMKTLYRKYHKQLKRGFTDEEFTTECEEIAGCSLEEFFEYVYTTKAIDYAKYLGYAGLDLEKPGDDSDKFHIKFLPNPNPLQSAILNDWLKDERTSPNAS